MAKDSPQPERGGCGVQGAVPAGLPQPSLRFRRRSWLDFQRALDPLAPPKQLPPPDVFSPRERPPPAGG